MKSFEGYLKEKLGDSYVLLAEGGHKAISDFKIGDYLPLSGGTLTNNVGWALCLSVGQIQNEIQEHKAKIINMEMRLSKLETLTRGRGRLINPSLTVRLKRKPLFLRKEAA